MIESVVSFLDASYCRQFIFALIVYILFKFYFSKLSEYLQDKLRGYTDRSFDADTSEKDVVYLYQFHRSATVPNSSPFCLKVEAFLRYHKIPYKPIFTQFQRSKEGLLPFIVINGETICDSQVILLELEKRYNLTPSLSPKDSAIARAADRTIDNSLANAILYFKIIKNKDQVRAVINRLMPGILATLSFNHIYQVAKRRLSSLYFSTIPEADIRKGLELDLAALDELLGNKEYLFGSEPVQADFGLFANLATMYYTPYNQPLKDILDNQFPRLQKYTEKMLTENFQEYRMYY